MEKEKLNTGSHYLFGIFPGFYVAGIWPCPSNKPILLLFCFSCLVTGSAAWGQTARKHQETPNQETETENQNWNRQTAVPSTWFQTGMC